VCFVRFMMFDYCEFLWLDVGHVSELKRNLLSIILFWWIRLGNWNWACDNGDFAWCKDNIRSTKVCGLYMIDGYAIIVGYASVASQDSHGKTKLWDLGCFMLVTWV
jgi:hypothetical protein